DTASGGAGFAAQWGAAFLWTVRSAIIGPDDASRDMEALASVVAQTYNGNAASWYSKKRSTLGAALVLTSPGIPMLFMGQEFLENGWFHNDPQELDWSKAATYAGIVQLYRDLIHLRRNWFNNTRGLRGQHTNVFHVDNGAKVLAFHRWDEGGNGD